MVGPEVPLQDSLSDDLGLGVKSFLPERNGASPKPETPREKCPQKSLDTDTRR
jgi:hypothetical protein